MSCISKQGRCTKCCEAIHIPTQVWIDIKKHRNPHPDAARIRGYWTPISKRRAKKINPYIFSAGFDKDHKDFLKTASFFSCKMLTHGVGCSIRHDEDHPNVCKEYKGGYEYSPTCPDDINIIARSRG